MYKSMWALFIILCYDALGHTNWICACKCTYVPVFVCLRVCVCVPVCRPQHTDGRLIKQLIKARALGSEMRLLLFGKNCLTRHKGKKNWKGRGEKRELGESEYHRHGPGMCQSLSYGAPLHLLLLLLPAASRSLRFLYLHVSTSARACASDIAAVLSQSDSNQEPQETLQI